MGQKVQERIGINIESAFVNAWVNQELQGQSINECPLARFSALALTAIGAAQAEKHAYYKSAIKVAGIAIFLLSNSIYLMCYLAKVTFAMPLPFTPFIFSGVVLFGLLAGVELFKSMPQYWDNKVSIHLRHQQELLTLAQNIRENATLNRTEPPRPRLNDPYYDLPRTTEDEEKISDIIVSMSIYGKFHLLCKHKKRLEQLGREIESVNSFRFLGYIFAPQNGLKACLKKSFTDHFKRVKFMTDLKNSLNAIERPEQWVRGFADEIQMDPEPIRELVERKNWDDLVKHLLQN